MDCLPALLLLALAPTTLGAHLSPDPTGTAEAGWRADSTRTAESRSTTDSRWAVDARWVADLAWKPHPPVPLSPALASTCEVAAFIGGGMVGGLVGAVIGVTIERAIYEGEDAGITGMAVGMIGGWILGSQLARRRCGGGPAR